MDVTAQNLESGVCVVRISGRIDASNAVGLEARFNEIISGGQTRLAADMSGVVYISSGGLRVLLAAIKKVKPGGGDLRLFALDPNVMKILQLSGFTKIFSTHATQAEAVVGL
jgi:anti-sigma B factor antagonist